jgi:hypothetical protein
MGLSSDSYNVYETLKSELSDVTKKANWVPVDMLIKPGRN